MKIKLLAIGKTATPYLREGMTNYLARLKHYIPFEFIELPDLKNTKALTTEMQKTREGEIFLKETGSSDFIVLLDEKGKEFTSRQFASYLDKRMGTDNRDIIFAIGGPYGFSQAVYERADATVSLSKMTFSHEMVRLFFVEQVYRAMTILKGEPYHHD